MVADVAKSCSALVPAAQHVKLQSFRAKFVVYSYWSKSYCESLRPEEVQGCCEESGYDERGTILLERATDLESVSNAMKDAVVKCSCKGKCNIRRCSCQRRGIRCIACDCDGRSCVNQIKNTTMQFSRPEHFNLRSYEE